jgi:hypothetical protein
MGTASDVSGQSVGQCRRGYFLAIGRSRELVQEELEGGSIGDSPPRDGPYESHGPMNRTWPLTGAVRDLDFFGEGAPQARAGNGDVTITCVVRA